MKNKDDALQQFREKFCGESRTSNDQLVGYYLPAQDEAETADLEAFLAEVWQAAQEATARDYEKVVVSSINNFGRVLNDKPLKPWIYIEDIVRPLQELKSEDTSTEPTKP